MGILRLVRGLAGILLMLAVLLVAIYGIGWLVLRRTCRLQQRLGFEGRKDGSRRPNRVAPATAGAAPLDDAPPAVPLT